MGVYLLEALEKPGGQSSNTTPRLFPKTWQRPSKRDLKAQNGCAPCVCRAACFRFQPTKIKTMIGGLAARLVIQESLLNHPSSTKNMKPEPVLYSSEAKRSTCIRVDQQWCREDCPTSAHPESPCCLCEEPHLCLYPCSLFHTLSLPLSFALFAFSLPLSPFLVVVFFLFSLSLSVSLALSLSLSLFQCC